MNLLIISPSTSGTISGLAYNLYNAFNCLENSSVYLLCLDGSEHEVPKGINAYIVSKASGVFCSSLKNLKRRIFTIRHIINDKSIDVTISTLLGCIFWSVLSGTKRDCKVGIFHTRPDQSKFLGIFKHIIFSFVYRYVLNRLDVVVAVNQTAKETIERKYKVKVYLIYNIHDFSKIGKLASQPVISSELFEKPTFLFVGHLTEVKAPERLVKAFAQINNENKYSLCFIGEGYLELYLKDLVRQYQLEQSVKFLGFKDNPYKYIKMCKCLVLPSLDEGLPGVLIEALSLGKRVITTNSSKGVWEILQCYEHYDPNLSYRYRNELGVIVPNYCNPETEDLTINELAKAMLEEVEHNRIIEHGSFDKTRFKADFVVSQYMEFL